LAEGLLRYQPIGEIMRVLLFVLLLAPTTFAQAQDPGVPSMLVCRTIPKIANAFVYANESVVGSNQACHVEALKTSQPVSVMPTPVVAAPAAAPAVAPTPAPVSVVTPPAPPAPAPVELVQPRADGKKRLYVTDEQSYEQIFIERQASNTNATGPYSGRSASAGGTFGYAQSGPDPRTVELQSDLFQSCPAIVVTANPSVADFTLVFRRQGGRRSQGFAFGGLAGLAFSAHEKVDGGAVFNREGDLVFATRAASVSKTIKEVCQHLK
jgi:hypothetical protein